jgi:hypothetical protein
LATGRWLKELLLSTIQKTKYEVTKGKKEARPPFYADDLMITKRNRCLPFNENAHELFYNNHLVKLNDSILFQ